MADVLKLPAPAKLNLFLHVTGRRPDGYHELQTVFQLLDWGDSVELKVTSTGLVERVTAIEGVPANEDLSMRAAGLLQERCGVRAGARIAVSKRIPQGGGLGGASTDAATVLVGLNELWNCGLAPDELAGLGLELGADVPVFVRGRSAWAEGVGDQLWSLELGERHYVLLLPALGVPTAEIFADPTLRRNAPRLERGSPWSLAGTRNDCQPVVLARCPELRPLLEPIARFGEPRMTGTGSTFFIEVADADEARRVTSRLKNLYNGRAVGVLAVRGVDRSPLITRLENPGSISS